ncbi:ABC transporter substrate-binding protein [Bauldia sp.]|uniref:ABC transporter substrate-binding protein n=1 Tax=Bauldia sp. TaxID=2575872 RepID=UPI003BA887BC
MRPLKVIGRGAVAGLAAMAVLATPARAETPIRFTLDWAIEGPAAPFLIARDKGYFAEEGLNVTIDTGSGSIESINRVASRAYDMGFGDLSAAIRFNDQNPTTPIKPVYMVYNKPAFAIIGRKSRGVSSPADLEGKTLGAPVTDASFTHWPIFAAENGIDPATVAIQNVGFPVRVPLLAAGRVDAITGFTLSALFGVMASGIPEDDIVVMPLADHGLDLYGNAVIVSPAFAADNQQAVEGFLRAFNRALKETIDDPEAAIDHVLAANALLDRETELAKLKLAIDQNIVTGEVRANGLGDVDTDRLNDAIDQLDSVTAFSAKPQADIAFDPRFLPARQKRLVD